MISKKHLAIRALLLLVGIYVFTGLLATVGIDFSANARAGGVFWKEATPGTSRGPSPIADFTGLAKRLSPVVVNISTTQKIKRRTIQPPPQLKGPFEDFFKDFNQFFNDQPREFKRQMLGSGFIINKEGYILTNEHVIEDASEIIVSLSDHKKDYKAKVIGKDKNLDIALIKINPAKPLHVAVLGDSDTLEIGAWVIAIGNPFGLGGTVTAGIVSQKGRILGAGPYDNFIQTDASINPGNSGGPLFNIRGEVVGINTAIIAGGQGIGFAIPINMVKEVLLQLKEKGKVTRGWIGVSVQTLTPELAKSFGLREPRGALVSSVNPGDPADKGGVKPGDIIVSFDGQEIKELNDLPRIVAATPPGKVISMKVIRDGKEKTLVIKVGKKEGAEGAKGAKAKPGPKARLGLTVESLTPDLAARLGVSQTKGIYISRIDPDSPAYEAGLRVGDVILEINRRPIKDIKSFDAALKREKKGADILFLIQRGHNTVYLVVKKK